MFNEAKWIWINENAEYNEYGEFVFRVAKGKSASVCKVSCDGDYTLFINGTYVASNQYGDYEQFLMK